MRNTEFLILGWTLPLNVKQQLLCVFITSVYSRDVCTVQFVTNSWKNGSEPVYDLLEN